MKYFSTFQAESISKNIVLIVCCTYNHTASFSGMNLIRPFFGATLFRAMSDRFSPTRRGYNKIGIQPLRQICFPMQRLRDGRLGFSKPSRARCAFNGFSVVKGRPLHFFLGELSGSWGSNGWMAF